MKAACEQLESASCPFRALFDASISTFWLGVLFVFSRDPQLQSSFSSTGPDMKTSIFFLTILAQWARAIPLGRTVTITSEEVVFQTVVVTKTTVICPSTAPGISSTLFYTTTIERPLNSLTEDSDVAGSSTTTRRDTGVSISSTNQGSQSSLLGSLTLALSSVSDVCVLKARHCTRACYVFAVVSIWFVSFLLGCHSNKPVVHSQRGPHLARLTIVLTCYLRMLHIMSTSSPSALLLFTFYQRYCMVAAEVSYY
jgi:hypothetical protein